METDKIRRVLSYTRRAVDDYKMINEGDRIAVGVSGGKDSITLLCALSELRRFYPNKYEIVALSVNMGFEGLTFDSVGDFCKEAGIEFREIKTSVAEIIFEARKESNPCSLCARMRRGILHDNAKELGCNKLALGHHYDDVLETFMLNLIHEGRIAAFSPVTYLDRKDITVIRPLVYCHEKDIKYFINKNPDLPLVVNPCPEDGKTERENVKELISSLDKQYYGFKHRLFGAIKKSHINGF